MMRQLATKVRSLDAGHWITIVVLLGTAAVNWGSTTTQIGELRRSQERTEQTQFRLEGKVDGVIAEQASVKAALAASEAKLDAHIGYTQQHFEGISKR